METLLCPTFTLLPDGVVRDHALLIAGDRIARVGPAQRLRRDHAQAQTVELADRLVMPGLVDAHHHLTQSLGKALAFGEPSEIYRRIWVPMERALDERAIHVSAMLACLESMRGGFTTVVEAGTRSMFGVEPLLAALRTTGLRCVLATLANDLVDGNPMTDSDRNGLIDAAERHVARFDTDATIHPSLAISVPEAASDSMLSRIYAICEEAGCIFQTHANEHLAAVERSLVACGRRPIEQLDFCDALGPRALLAHATLMTASEVTRVRDRDAALAYNPVASVWKGNGALDALMMHALGIRFGIGTDGTRSDGFRLLDAAETVQRVAHGLRVGDSSAGGGWTWLDHATSEGASAVGLQGATGRLAANHAADLLVVRLDVPELVPSYDLTWETVRYFNRDQIEAVYVAGRVRLRDGWPVDWNARALLDDARSIVERQVAGAPIQRVHPTADAHRSRTRAIRPPPDPP
ncbi:MAG TPA: amidohydrolase family protein [Casimicrobiaceae bacterium]|nr:amidohydrolase family protein [Casimicrobiaceae bacterium]